MFVLVLAAEADETRQAVTLLIVCLVGIAIMLALLTVWYWLFTSPKRRATRLLNDLGHNQASALTGSPDPVPAPGPVPASGPALVAGPAILSESSALMSSMLAESDPMVEPPIDVPVGQERPQPATGAVGERAAEPDDDGITTVESDDKTPARPPRPMRVVSSAPESIRRPVARPSDSPRRSPDPGSADDEPGRLPGARPITDDELAKARQRRAKRTRQQEGLSDDDWAAVMKSAFNHLNR